MNDDDDIVHPRFESAIPEKNIDELPAEVLCRGCHAPLATISKDQKRKKVGIQIHFTNPPKILNRAERLGLARCDKCGAQTQIDLLLFAAL